MTQNNKLPLKAKMVMFLLIIIFMGLYMSVFGIKNAVIGMMIALAMLMNFGNDLSYRPVASFIKVLVLFLIPYLVV